MTNRNHSYFHLSPTPLTSDVWAEVLQQEVRDYAAEQGKGVEVVIDLGMKEKAKEFTETGAEIYKKA